jgi:asparagine synthase (glutamine-hydrolysing)
MCGIAGILGMGSNAREPSPQELLRMVGVLHHRGPDGYGIYIDDHAGLAHARLSIIDRAGGGQPLCNEDSSIWVTFNGEIFNFIELRQELEALGHRFATRSDTETIVHAFEQWGRDCFAKFNGQFAIGLWDRKARELWLARDQAGICPLFIARAPGCLVFGSEAKAIFASGRIAAEPDAMGLAQAFVLWAAAAPTTCFKGVECLAPGTCRRYRLDGTQVEWSFAAMDFHPDHHSRATLASAAEELDDALTRAIRLRLRADVPVGAYLSGGLDSSVIAKLCALANKAPIETFSLRFDDTKYDEGSAQKRVAAYLGTRHHEIVVTPQHIQEHLPLVIRHCETPLTRAGPAPMFLLSGLVRELGFRVVLTGEGADEMFGGYDVFKEAKVRAFWARHPKSTMRPALLSRVHPYVANAASPDMWRAFFQRGLDQINDPFFSHRPRWENTSWLLRFLAPGVRESCAPQAMIERAANRLPHGWDHESVVSRAQTIEAAVFMSSYLLSSQGDRALMANSVEGRFPFLDPQVIALGRRLPDSLKLAGLHEKIVLRTVAAKYLPDEIRARRKWPYRAPITSALFGPGAPEYVRELLTPEALSRNALLDPKTASGLVQRGLKATTLSEREEMGMMGLLTLQLWDRSFLRGSASGDPRIAATSQPDQQPCVLQDNRTSAAARNRLERIGPTHA